MSFDGRGRVPAPIAGASACVHAVACASFSLKGAPHAGLPQCRAVTMSRVGRTVTWNERDGIMSLGLILVIILVIFLLGGFSGRFGGYGYGYGHGGIGVIGIVLIVIVVLLLMGRL
jgi:Na+/melibiose symporter-like transporter